MTIVCICILLIIIVFIFLKVISMYNKVKANEVKIEESKSDLETYLIKRYDVLTESVKAIESFKQHENEIFSEIFKPHSNMTEKEITEALNTQESAIKQLMALDIPEVRSSELYVKFQDQLTEENKHVAASKRMYNANVSIYNQYIVKFPVNLFFHKKMEFLSDENIDNKNELNISWNN